MTFTALRSDFIHIAACLLLPVIPFGKTRLRSIEPRYPMMNVSNSLISSIRWKHQQRRLKIIRITASRLNPSGAKQQWYVNYWTRDLQWCLLDCLEKSKPNPPVSSAPVISKTDKPKRIVPRGYDEWGKFVSAFWLHHESLVSDRFSFSDWKKRFLNKSAVMTKISRQSSPRNPPTRKSSDCEWPKSIDRVATTRSDRTITKNRSIPIPTVSCLMIPIQSSTWIEPSHVRPDRDMRDRWAPSLLQSI